MGKLRVWWVPQVGIRQTFYIPVKTVEGGKKIMDILAAYDLFQLQNNVKPDYSNVGGLQMWDEEEKEQCEKADELEEFNRQMFAQMKALKADIYRFSNSANEAYYYLMNPDEAVRKNSNLEKLERIYKEKSEKLKDLKYVAKIFYTAPYIRRQFIDDDTTLKDIQKEIDKTERHLNHLEMKINTANADYKIEKIMEKYKYKYTYAMQRLNSCQKKLKEIEKILHILN